nr:hypothetical protein [Moritella viscosa]
MVWDQDELAVLDSSDEDNGSLSMWDEGNSVDYEAEIPAARYEEKVNHSFAKSKDKDKVKKRKRRVGTKFFERPTVSLDTEFTE